MLEHFWCHKMTDDTPGNCYICPLELVQQILAFPVSEKFIMIVYSSFKPWPHLLIGKPLSPGIFFTLCPAYYLAPIAVRLHLPLQE